MTVHVHDWQPWDDDPTTDLYQCAEHDCDATSPRCNTCERRPTGTSLLICEPCLEHQRRILDDIDHALDQWQPTPPTPLKAARYDRIIVTGTTTTDAPADPVGPWTVLDTLADWARAWSDASGHHGTDGYTTFLKSMLVWAAQNPDTSMWGEYRDAMGKARHTARRVAGLLPKPHPAPCIHCGGIIVQDRADENWEPLEDGLSDTLRCTGCSMTWGDRDRVTALAVRVAMTMDPDPDAEVTEAQARALIKVGTSTIRQWVRRGHLTRAGTRRGVATYRLGDITQLADGGLVDVAG